MKYTELRLLGKRPGRAGTPFHVNSSEIDRRGSLVAGDLVTIPSEWEIWNAPRPLSGHITWQGDFQHGTWWAAIDATDNEAPLRLAESWRRYNIDMDGWLVLWLPRDDTLRAYADGLKAKYPDAADDIEQAVQALCASSADNEANTLRKQLAWWLEESWSTEHRMTVVQV